MFLLAVTDFFTKDSLAIMKKPGVSITNAFRTILLEGRTPKKLWV